MAIYRVDFITKFAMQIEATDDSEARRKADEMVAVFSAPSPVAMDWNGVWNTIHRVGGDDD